MRKTRIFICALLVIGMIVSAGILSVNAASSSASAYTGTADTTWYNASTTTFTIDSAAKFAGFVNLVNNGTNFSGKTVKLGVDIVWSKENADTWSTDFAPEDYRWTPIGSSSTNCFKGTFDGQGHTVSGLYYYSKTDSYAGLFGYVNGATIKNVRVVNSYIDAFNQVGSIVGRADGSVTIQNCYSDAYIFSNNPVATNHYVGGIIGYCHSNSATSSITGCVFKGKIISENGCDVAGIVGRCDGGITNISECIVKAKIVGYNRVAGILGRLEGTKSTIQNCYTDCEYYIFGTANYGGIISGCRNTTAQLKIANCFYTGHFYTAAHSAIGGFTEIAPRVGSLEYNGEKLTAAEYAKKDSEEQKAYTLITDDSGNQFYGIPYGTYTSGISFYTDTTGDISNYAHGDQRGGIGTANASTKENFVNNVTSTYFGINTYGDVYLKRYNHSHTEHCYGEWIADGNGQKRQCTIGKCDEVETRELNIKIAGAQVRFEEPSGIRFGTAVKKNDAYKALYGDGEYEYSSSAKVTFGTLILPTYMLGDSELTVNTNGAMNIPAQVIYEETDDEIVFTGVLIDVPENFKTYRMDLTARSYIKVKEAGQDPVYYYSDSAVRSFYDVANAAYAAQNDDVKAGLNMLIGLGCIDDDFYEESAQNVKILENASVEQFEHYKELLAANGFTKYSENTIADNLFATYTNDKYIVYTYFTPRTIGKYTQNGIDGNYGDKVRNLVENQLNAPYHIGQSMTEMQKYITIEDVDNVIRVIVDRKDMTDLPALQEDNIYTKNPTVKTSIIEIKPNDILLHYGMGYIIRLADGSFLMIDGGENVQESGAKAGDPYDCDNVYNILKNLSGGKEPVIAAWILTHRHNDHVDMFEAFVKKYGDKAKIEQVICNFGGGVDGLETERGYVNAYMQKKVATYSPETKLVKAHTGQKFYLRNAEMTLMFTMDDFSQNDTSIWQNNESLVFEVVVDGTQKLMFTGEVFIPGSRALIRMYGESGELESDVLQLAHHGHFGATKELYEYIMPKTSTRETEKFILWPCGNYRQVWNTIEGYYGNDFGNRFGLAENAYILDVAKANKYHVYFYYDIGTNPTTESTYTYNKSRYYNPGNTSIKGGAYTVIPIGAVTETGDDNLGYWMDIWN